MPTTITVRDEVLGAPALPAFELTLPERSLTARELIQERVRAEIPTHDEHHREALFRGLVQPSGSRPEGGGGYRLRPGHRIDAEAQCAQALQAFESKGFLLLVGDRQVVSLDELIALDDDLAVTFLKLTPLVGG